MESVRNMFCVAIRMFCFSSFFGLHSIPFKLYIHYPLSSIPLSSLTSCIRPCKQASTVTTSVRLGACVFFKLYCPFCVLLCCFWLVKRLPSGIIPKLKLLENTMCGMFVTMITVQYLDQCGAAGVWLVYYRKAVP